MVTLISIGGRLGSKFTVFFPCSPFTSVSAFPFSTPFSPLLFALLRIRLPFLLSCPLLLSTCLALLCFSCGHTVVSLIFRRFSLPLISLCQPSYRIVLKSNLQDISLYTWWIFLICSSFDREFSALQLSRRA